MESNPFSAKFILFLKTKQQYKPKNRLEKRKAAIKTKAAGEKHAHHSHGCHHGQTMVATKGHGDL